MTICSIMFSISINRILSNMGQNGISPANSSPTEQCSFTKNLSRGKLTVKYPRYSWFMDDKGILILNMLIKTLELILIHGSWMIVILDKNHPWVGPKWYN